MLFISLVMVKMGGGDLVIYLFVRINFVCFGLVWSMYEEDKIEDEKMIKKSLVYCRLIFEIIILKFYRGGCFFFYFCFKIGLFWVSEILWRVELLWDS